jgi:hypothetical protein
MIAKELQERAVVILAVSIPFGARRLPGSYQGVNFRPT